MAFRMGCTADDSAAIRNPDHPDGLPAEEQGAAQRGLAPVGVRPQWTAGSPGSEASCKRLRAGMRLGKLRDARCALRSAAGEQMRRLQHTTSIYRTESA